MIRELIFLYCSRRVNKLRSLGFTFVFCAISGKSVLNNLQI